MAGGMRWEKLGRVFVADGQHDWMRTHAAWARAVHLRDDLFRVFFSVRDVRGRSHIAFLDMDVTNPGEILSLSEAPVLSPGAAGHFDDSGVIPCDVVWLGGRPALYYGGLSMRHDRCQCHCGLAYLDAELRTATRALTAPLLESNGSDPFGGGAVCVRHIQAGDAFHMWYESCTDIPAVPDGTVPRFAIKHAISPDGVRWNRLEEISIGDSGERSYVSNPSVVIVGNLFRMWYSYKRGDRYRIGYAESGDGGTWTRKDDRAGMTTSVNGWDSEDVEYPCVFTHGPDTYMLYNGNQYGRTGFGLARLARD
jgi:predicted GH43/DUF377 family glycosyl hydrolase